MINAFFWTLAWRNLNIEEYPFFVFLAYFLSFLWMGNLCPTLFGGQNNATIVAILYYMNTWVLIEKTW